MLSTPSVPKRLLYSGRFMVAVGVIILLISAFGSENGGMGGVLVLAGASILLPEREKATRIGMAVAGFALAVATVIGSGR